MGLAQLGQGMPEKADCGLPQTRCCVPHGRDFAAFAEADLAMYEGRLSDAATVLTAGAFGGVGGPLRNDNSTPDGNAG